MTAKAVAAAGASLALAYRLGWVYRELARRRFPQMQRSLLLRAFIDAFVGLVSLAGEASVGLASPVIIRRVVAAALADDVYRHIRYSALARYAGQ